jgi:uncharacterized protein YqeY
MSLQDTLTSDLQDAMRKGEAARRTALRLVISGIKYAEVAQGHPLDDAGVLKVITKEVKEHRESLLEFERGNRPDLVARTKEEMEILMQYLPQQMSAEEISQIVSRVIDEVGAKDPADLGKVMPKVMAETRGRADGREVNRMVQEYLAKK